MNSQHDFHISIEKDHNLSTAEWGLLSSLCKEYPTFKVRFDEISREELDNIYKYNIQFYLRRVCGDHDMVQALLRMGVSDIYIGGVAGFNINNIVKSVTYLNDEGEYEKLVTLRCIPNRVQTVEGLPDIKGFFIRPEDIQLYTNLGIDVFELDSTDAPAVTLRAYKHDKCWYGDLSEIIYGLNTELDSKRLSYMWGNIRANCNKRCFLGARCQICDLFLEQTKQLAELGIVAAVD